MRIGVFGGSFNPIHLGHLIVANYAIINGGMDKILFIPSGNHPFLEKRKVTQGNIRLEMVKSAIGDDELFEVSDIEVNSKEISYTYDTISKLKLIYPNDELFFLIGYDILYDLPKWRKIEELSKISSFLVMERKTKKENQVENIVKKLIKDYDIKLNFVESPLIEVSSSEIRRLIKENKRVNYLVPKSVLDIIKREKLYVYGS